MLSLFCVFRKGAVKLLRHSWELVRSSHETPKEMGCRRGKAAESVGMLEATAGDAPMAHFYPALWRALLQGSTHVGQESHFEKSVRDDGVEGSGFSVGMDTAMGDRSFAALRMTGLAKASAGILRVVAIGCPCPSCAFCTTVILSEVEGSIHR